MRRRPGRRGLAGCAAGLLMAARAVAAGPGPAPAPIVRVALPDGSSLKVELADTAAARAIGLRYRTSVPEGWGMLFDYGSEQAISLWMQDCPVAVSVAFLDTRGRVLGVEELRPLDETVRRRSRGAARYALAAGAGVLAARGLVRGSRVGFLRQPLLAGETRPRMPVEGPLLVPAARPEPTGSPLGPRFAVEMGGGEGGGP